MTKRYGVELKPRLVDAEGRRVRFDDGSELEVDAVIWATGYRPDYSWIKLPIFDEDGRLRHRRGVTDVPGLYFLGLTWQYTRGSALIGFVKDDAEFIAEQIAQYQQSKAQAAPTTARRRRGSRAQGRPPRGCSRCTSQATTHHSQHEPSSRARPRACRMRAPTELVELADGDEFELEIAPVKKQIGDATVRMLAYNGSVPGPTLKVPAGRDDHRPRHEPRRPRRDRALARAAAREPLRRHARDAGADPGRRDLHLPGARARPGRLLVPPAHPRGLRPGDGPLREHPRHPERARLLAARQSRAARSRSTTS